MRDRLRLGLTLAVVVAVVVWPVTGAVSAATADSGAVEDRPTLTTPVSQDDCVVSSSGAYPDTFQVTCERVDGEWSIRVRGQGGWAYVVHMNTTQTRVLDLDLQSQTTVNETVQAGELAFVGPISAQTLPTDAIRETWRSRLQVDRSEVGIAVQSSIVGQYVPGSDPPKARLFRPLAAGVVAKPGPGTYRLRLVAYEQTPPIPVQQGSTTGALRAQMEAAIENAPTKTATVTVQLGDCESRLAVEQNRAQLFDQQQDVRTETKRAAQDHRETQQTSVDVSSDAFARGTPNAAMTAGLPSGDEGGPAAALEATRNRQSAMHSAFGALDEIQEAYETGKRTVQAGVDEVLDRWVRVSREDATEAVAGALAEEGVSPPAGSGLELEDYVTTGAQRTQRRDELGRGQRTVRIRIGPNGNILPTPENLPDVDPCGERKLQRSTTWLKLEFNQLPGDDYDVVGQRIDVDTSEITDAKYAGWNEQNSDLDSVVGEAIDGLGGVEGAADGTTSDGSEGDGDASPSIRVRDGGAATDDDSNDDAGGGDS